MYVISIYLSLSLSLLSQNKNTTTPRAFKGVWFAKDQMFPTARRKVWEQLKISKCQNEQCSRTFPDGCNRKGGVCLSCMTPDAGACHTRLVSSPQGPRLVLPG